MVIITGPTSAGKTSLAIKLAKKFGAELISADSRQIYKHMDVGTGKKPLNLAKASYAPHDKYWEIEGIKIHMYDVVSPNQEYSSVQFASDAKSLMSKIDLPIIVGGTGFYIDSLVLDHIETKVVPDTKLRDELSKKTLSELAKMIPSEYLDTWNNSEKNNPARLIRAIQINRQTGEWPSKANSKVDPSQNNLVIELTAPREFLYERVDAWAETIWDSLIEETQKLIDMGYRTTQPLNGIIYKTVLDFLEGKQSRESSLELIKFDLHKYIRRQQTWFKKYKHSRKVDITEKSFDTEVFSLVESYLYER